MKFNRESGILLHPTSLPSKYGIGDLGKEAYEFIDFLYNSKQRLWQVLPLGPVGYGESPYQSFSAFAGNTMLISIDRMIELNILTRQDILSVPSFNADKVDFEPVKEYKQKLFKLAFNRFCASDNEAFELFVEENGYWLDEYSFFMALKDHFGGVAWNCWEKSIAKREAYAMEYYKKLLRDEITYQKFLQFMFFTQWLELKAYANKKNIKIIGDIPIFISNDSSDAWSQRELFEINEEGYPIKVAGVPPDFFSETGQYWGNPHYKWDKIENSQFKWWIDRFEMLLKVVDIIRIDHFRGFEAYWEIPGSEVTAINGKWVKAPGKKLFAAIEKHLGKLPIIVEDLGVITKEVEQLKKELDFPGMKILQFTFGKGSEERFLPHNYEIDSVVYTGTHDNNTTVGWYKDSLQSQPEAIEQLKRHFDIKEDVSPKDICWKLIEIAFRCNSVIAIVPMQDLLCLDSEARMNIPSTIGGNWNWRFNKEHATVEIESRLIELSKENNRNQ
ncbi:MAG: 4-alpha-glucanotransferase [Clostridiales bacterium GWB2_37_7]|nr:MAG: 4-alpha-glucanotransferase [Clostridiales bacterium GWB2_37_7]